MELYENDLRLKSRYEIICGVDEAGRGPLAGPVFTAAVILPHNCDIKGLNDSKKLTEKKRELLFDEIISKAAAYSIVSVDEKTIDKVNILNATLQGMFKAVKSLTITPDITLIDGNKVPNGLENAKWVVGGDAKYACIAAASILAKVSRDRYMLSMAEKYPQYFFEKHKGYGTKLHYEMLEKYGPCEIHRRTFIKDYV